MGALENARARPKAKSKARLASYDRMMQEAEQARGAQTHATVKIMPGPRLGGVVLESRAWRRNTATRGVLFKDLTFPAAAQRHRRSDRAQRRPASRRCSLITGQETPDAGSIRLGETVACPTSTRAAARSIGRERSGGRSSGPRRAQGQRPGDQHALLRRLVQLQGRRPARRSVSCRAANATGCTWPKTLTEGGNVDPARRADQRPRHRDLAETWRRRLEDFAGCAVVISHDRWFLDRLCTHILAFEKGDSHVEWFEGNFEGLRGRQETPPRRRQPDPQAHQVPSTARTPAYEPAPQRRLCQSAARANRLRNKDDRRQGAGMKFAPASTSRTKKYP